MSEKYTIVQHEKRLFWLQDCPVLLQSYALTKNNVDNSIFLQCKFENIADKSIKAMYITVKCSDIAYKQVSNVDNFSYLDISIEPYSLFGDKTPVMLPDNTARNVTIIPLKVIFSDDSTWENTSERAYELAEYEQQSVSSLGELAEQYKRDLHTICADSDKHNYLPIKANGFTICGCGQVIKSDVLSCPACGIAIKKLFALNNSSVLREHLTQYQATQEQTQKNQKAKKRKFIRNITAAGIAIVLAVSIPLGYSTIKKNAFMKAHDTAQSYSDRFSASSRFAAWITDDGNIMFTEPYRNIGLTSDQWYDLTTISAHENTIYGERADKMHVRMDISSMNTEVYSHSDSQISDARIVKEVGELQLLENGTVESSSLDTSRLKNVVDIDESVVYSNRRIIYAALTSKGSVNLLGVSTGYLQRRFNTDTWKDIIQISASETNIVGLKSDGKAVVTGFNNYGQCDDIANWTDIIAVKAENDSIYGIKEDGTVIGAGYIPQHCNYDLNEVKLW